MRKRADPVVPEIKKLAARRLFGESGLPFWKDVKQYRMSFFFCFFFFFSLSYWSVPLRSLPVSFLPSATSLIMPSSYCVERKVADHLTSYCQLMWSNFSSTINLSPPS